MSLVATFRNAISEGSDTGFLIAADALEESSDPTDNKLAELLRLHLDVQTYIRTSNSIPLEKANRFQELNDTFNSQDREPVGNTGWYSKKLGPFYMQLSMWESELLGHMDYLSVQPIRDLEIQRCLNPEAILRNYRMDYLTSLSLRFYGNRVASNTTLAQMVQSLKASQLRVLHFNGINDRLGTIRMMFNLNKSIPKGCELWVNGIRVSVHK